MSPGLFSIYLQVWTFCNRERKKNCVPFAFRSGICIRCFRLRCVFHLWEIGGRFVYWRYFSLTSSWMGCFLFCIWFSSIFVKENSERGLKVRLRNWNVLGFILGVHFDFFTLILRMIIKHVIAIWWFLHPCYGFVGSWEPCLCFAMWFRCNLVIDLFWPLSRMKILCLKLKEYYCLWYNFCFSSWSSSICFRDPYPIPTPLDTLPIISKPIIKFMKIQI